MITEIQTTVGFFSQAIEVAEGGGEYDYFIFFLFSCLGFLSGKAHKICTATPFGVVLTLELKRRANFSPVGVVSRYSIIA